MKIFLNRTIILFLCLIPISLLHAMDDFEQYMPQCNEAAIKEIQALPAQDSYPYDMSKQPKSIDDLMQKGNQFKDSNPELAFCCILHAYLWQTKSSGSLLDDCKQKELWDHIEQLIKHIETPKVEAIIAKALQAGLNMTEGLDILGIHYYSHGNLLKAHAAWTLSKTPLSFDWLINTSSEPQKSYYYLAKARQGCLASYILFAQEQELVCGMNTKLMERAVHYQEWTKNEMINERYEHLGKFITQEKDLLSFFKQLQDAALHEQIQEKYTQLRLKAEKEQLYQHYDELSQKIRSEQQCLNEVQEPLASLMKQLAEEPEKTDPAQLRMLNEKFLKQDFVLKQDNFSLQMLTRTRELLDRYNSLIQKISNPEKKLELQNEEQKLIEQIKEDEHEFELLEKDVKELEKSKNELKSNYHVNNIVDAYSIAYLNNTAFCCPLLPFFQQLKRAGLEDWTVLLNVAINSSVAYHCNHLRTDKNDFHCDNKSCPGAKQAKKAKKNLLWVPPIETNQALANNIQRKLEERVVQRLICEQKIYEQAEHGNAEPLFTQLLNKADFSIELNMSKTASAFAQLWHQSDEKNRTVIAQHINELLHGSRMRIALEIILQALEVGNDSLVMALYPSLCNSDINNHSNYYKVLVGFFLNQEEKRFFALLQNNNLARSLFYTLFNLSCRLPVNYDPTKSVSFLLSAAQSGDKQAQKIITPLCMQNPGIIKHNMALILPAALKEASTKSCNGLAAQIYVLMGGDEVQRRHAFKQWCSLLIEPEKALFVARNLSHDLIKHIDQLVAEGDDAAKMLFALRAFILNEKLTSASELINTIGITPYPWGNFLQLALREMSDLRAESDEEYIAVHLVLTTCKRPYIQNYALKSIELYANNGNQFAQKLLPMAQNIHKIYDLKGIVAALKQIHKPVQFQKYFNTYCIQFCEHALPNAKDSLLQDEITYYLEVLSDAFLSNFNIDKSIETLLNCLLSKNSLDYSIANVVSYLLKNNHDVRGAIKLLLNKLPDIENIDSFYRMMVPLESFNNHCFTNFLYTLGQKLADQKIIEGEQVRRLVCLLHSGNEELEKMALQHLASHQKSNNIVAQAELLCHACETCDRQATLRQLGPIIANPNKLQVFEYLCQHAMDRLTKVCDQNAIAAFVLAGTFERQFNNYSTIDSTNIDLLYKAFAHYVKANTLGHSCASKICQLALKLIQYYQTSANHTTKKEIQASMKKNCTPEVIAKELQSMFQSANLTSDQLVFILDQFIILASANDTLMPNLVSWFKDGTTFSFDDQLAADLKKAGSSLKDILFVLSSFYKRINHANWLILATKAEELGHELAGWECALYRINSKTCPQVQEDLIKLEAWADKGKYEIMKFIADTYSENTTLPCGTVVKADPEKVYKYLKILDGQQQILSANQYYRLAKIAAAGNDQVAISKDFAQAYHYLKLALNLGYQCPEDDDFIWATVCFELQHFEETLQYLQRCTLNKSVACLRCLARLKLQKDHPHDPETDQLIWQDLGYILRIEHDRIELPSLCKDQSQLLFEKLKDNLNANEEAQELFVRFCLASGLENQISENDFITMTCVLSTSASPSAWNLMALLFRTGHFVEVNKATALKYLLSTLRKDNLPSWIRAEAIEQLTLMAQTLLSPSFNFKADKDNECCVIAAHTIAKNVVDVDPFLAATWFTKADDIIARNFTADQPQYCLAEQMGSLEALQRCALNGNLDCATAVVRYLFYHSNNSQTAINEAKKWFHLFEKIEKKSRDTYVIGENVSRDIAISHAYEMFGSLMVINNEPNADERAFPYFKLALKYDPESSIKLSIARTCLNGSPTRDEALEAIRSLTGFADNKNPSFEARYHSAEASYLLWKAYWPQSRPSTFPIPPNKELALTYLNKAVKLKNPEAQKALEDIKKSQINASFSQQHLRRFEDRIPGGQLAYNVLVGSLYQALDNQHWDSALLVCDILIEKSQLIFPACVAANVSLTFKTDYPQTAKYLIKALDLSKNCQIPKYQEELFKEVVSKLGAIEDPVAQRMARLVQAKCMQKK